MSKLMTRSSGKVAMGPLVVNKGLFAINSLASLHDENVPVGTENKTKKKLMIK